MSIREKRASNALNRIIERNFKTNILIFTLEYYVKVVYNFNKPEKKPMLDQRLHMQKVYADSFYSWATRSVEWKGLLESMIEPKS